MLSRSVEAILPRDIILIILSFLQKQGLGQMGRTSRFFREAARESLVWQSVFKRNFGGEVPESLEAYSFYKAIDKDERSLVLDNLLLFHYEDLVHTDESMKDAKSTGMTADKFAVKYAIDEENKSKLIRTANEVFEYFFIKSPPFTEEIIQVLFWHASTSDEGFEFLLKRWKSDHPDLATDKTDAELLEEMKKMREQSLIYFDLIGSIFNVGAIHLLHLLINKHPGLIKATFSMSCCISLIHLALMTEKKAMLALLIQKGADVNLTRSISFFRKKQKGGVLGSFSNDMVLVPSPLLAAIVIAFNNPDNQACIDNIKLLLQAGSRVNLECSDMLSVQPDSPIQLCHRLLEKSPEAFKPVLEYVINFKLQPEPTELPRCAP